MAAGLKSVAVTSVYSACPMLSSIHELCNHESPDVCPSQTNTINHVMVLTSTNTLPEWE